MTPVHLLIGHEVRAEEDSVGVLDKELAGGIGLPAQLCRTRADVNVKVYVLVEPAAYLRKVLGALADVGAEIPLGQSPEHL